jgi:hypothetical protein
MQHARNTPHHRHQEANETWSTVEENRHHPKQVLKTDILSVPSEQYFGALV